MSEVITIPRVIDKLSVIYGLIAFAKFKVMFEVDKAYYLAKIEIGPDDAKEIITVGWMEADDFRVLKDAGLVNDDNIVKKV